MNTSGIIRGYMSKSMEIEKFIKKIVSTLNQEFYEDKEQIILEITNNEFIIKMEEYQIVLSKDLAEEIKSPYGIDKYILDKFKKQGFKFDKNKSQYIQYCYDNYSGDLNNG